MSETARVSVHVQSQYVASQSSPDDERYVFAYTITIRNLGRSSVQLLGRYWLITNGNAAKRKFRVKAWSVNSRLSRQAMNFSTPAVP